MIKAWGSVEKAREVVYRNYQPIVSDPITARVRGYRPVPDRDDRS